jgi:TolB protein
MSAADMMFQSDEPFATPRSSVNVFGEVDGFGPSVFNVGGQGGFQQHTTVDEGYDADPAVSPDGTHLLFTSTRHTEHPDIYVQRVDGLAVTQLTTDPADDGFARFSPDGKRVAFASNRSGNWDIYVMDADGKNVEQITHAAANEIHPTFSPDGTRLAFSSLGTRSGQWELWTVDITSGRRQMIGYGLFPDWSPRKDKDVIAFQRARQRGTRWFSAWTLEITGDDARNVTEVAYSANAAIVSPRWNADGTRLTFCSIIDPNASDTAELSEQVRGTTQDIWVVNADGTNRQRLTDGKGINATPTWAQDGRVYFISDRGGNDAIWSVSAGGSNGVAAKAAAAESHTAAADVSEAK